MHLFMRLPLQLVPYHESYGVRYNARRVEHFARVLCLRHAFLPWARLAKRWSRATKVRHKLLRRILQASFSAWGGEAKRSHKLKVI